MQINANNNLIAANADNTLAASNNQTAKSSKTSGVGSAAEYESSIRLSVQAEQIDSEAVAQAKLDLANGLLDTPEQSQAAAENILKFGI